MGLKIAPFQGLTAMNCLASSASSPAKRSSSPPASVACFSSSVSDPLSDLLCDPVSDPLAGSLQKAKKIMESRERKKKAPAECGKSN